MPRGRPSPRSLSTGRRAKHASAGLSILTPSDERDVPMNENENRDTQDTRQVPSPGRDTQWGEDRSEAPGAWESYSLEVLHALDD